MNNLWLLALLEPVALNNIVFLNFDGLITFLRFIPVGLGTK